MSNLRALFLLALVLHSAVVLVFAQGSATNWPTLTGDEPLVIARGGVSGVFPDSSTAAYDMAMMTSLSNLVLWCDVQLTKDAVGFCFPELTMDNSSNIGQVFPKGAREYNVDGIPTTGYFPIDFTFENLSYVALVQGVVSRTSKFDGNLYPVLTVKDVFQRLKPPASLWLNFEHPAFYAEHGLSMRNFLLSVSRKVIVNYISSPDVAFLNSIRSRISLRVTQLVFRILGQDEIEPSTNLTYGSMLKNLTFIKTFSSGILVPKYYIWPVDAKNYLEPHSTLVSDAHNAGLKIFAYNFANDAALSYNYSYDPVAEYLSFIDGGEFSVDGVLSDFPITPSEAIGCFAHLGKNSTVQAAKPLVISKFGASGDYPGCTDLAYKKAIADGVDVLDCPVQMSKDGILFCSSSINLIDSTTVAQSSFSNLTMSIPQIKAGTGIFTFSLDWSEIKTLTPSISNPFTKYTLFRNPLYKNAGQFLTLSEFLDLTKNMSSLSGISIGIEYAAYLAEKQQLSVTDAVLSALRKAGFSNGASLKIMIQSSNSSVLMKFKEKSNYERVYKIEQNIQDALDSTIEDIKKFADSVVVNKDSVFPETQLFLTGATDVVTKLQSLKLPVYVETFSNEFVSQPWDFFSDATVEINSYAMGVNNGIDGVITDFPQTAARYKRNWCLGLGNNTPQYMTPIAPGTLIQLITVPYLPPAEAPNPVLTVSDVMEPPLPSVAEMVPAASPGGSQGASPSPSRPNGHPKISASCFMLSWVFLLTTLFVF